MEGDKLPREKERKNFFRIDRLTGLSINRNGESRSGTKNRRREKDSFAIRVRRSIDIGGQAFV